MGLRPALLPSRDWGGKNIFTFSRWYLKPSKYSCLICSEQNNSGLLFNSIKSVLLHIVKSHQQRFLAEYADTLTEDSFLLCKICKSFISFNNITSERARRRKELGHYFLNHGQVFLYSLGVLSVPAANVYSCNLCHEAAPSYKLFTDHLQAHHAQDLVQRFRYFDLRQLETVARPAVCCVCRGADNSPAHLAQHSADTLVMIGLIEVMKQMQIVKYFYLFLKYFAGD